MKTLKDKITLVTGASRGTGADVTDGAQAASARYRTWRRSFPVSRRTMPVG